MTPKIKIKIKITSAMVLSLGLAVLAAGCGHPQNLSPEEPGRGVSNIKMESMLVSNPDSPVHTIVMPHDEPVFPPGPGREEFVTACVVCHSPRYITMQPPFPRTTWLSEVKKMKDVYGAHISDEQVLKITDYLVSIHGKAGTGQGPKGTYGE
jgi:mono/diheme cytochrome c family protein